MSQENLEIVRLAYAALSEADRDALTELTASNWVFDFSRSIGPDEGVYRGREQVFRFVATYGEAFERFQLAPIEYVVGPGGEIVVRHQVSAKGRGSGVEWERVPDAAMVWELRDDKVIKTTLYQHHAEALEAVGLREEAISEENVAEENVELMRGYEAMSALDAEALVAVCDPDVEFHSRIADAEHVTYRGHDGVRAYIASLSEVFEWVQTEALEVIQGDDRAVVCNRFRARGRGSGVEVEDYFFHAIRSRDGKAVWWAFYPSKAEALEAVGLRE